MEWQTTENNDVIETNENLRNTIEKSREYKLNSFNLRFRQCLYENTLGFEMPISLLNLWINFFKDAAHILNELNDEWLKVSERHNEYLLLSVNSLLMRLNEYEKMFEKFLVSTRSFAQRSEKLKRSTLKQYEDLKFIPINLHCEHFLVESNDYTNTLKTKCYDFVSVGAFTTSHVAKSIFPKQTDYIISEHTNTHKNLMLSEPILVFYSLKVLILVLNNLKQIRSSEDKIKIVLELAENIEIICRSLIPSYQRNKMKKYELLKTPTQDFSNKINYLSVKFYELNQKIKQTDFENLDHLLARIIDPLVEFYNLIFMEQISEKIEFMNTCACFSHAMSTLVTSLDLRYYKNSKENPTQLKDSYEFHVKNGILFQIESILSCFSNEVDMMHDHFIAIQALQSVYIHFPLENQGLITESNSSIFTNLERDGYHIYFYSNFDSATPPIRVHPILFNVGINEQAISSNLFGNNLLQKLINSNSIIKLRKYYDNVRDSIEEMELKFKLDTLLKRLETTKSFIDDSRPIELLHLTSEVTRLLNGLRVTNCKSGKDRTGVSVSLEQCFILIRNHNLDNNLTQYVLDDLRRNGTRLEVVRKNVGQKRYAFNKIRYFLLPQLYRPPIDLCDDLET